MQNLKIKVEEHMLRGSLGIMFHVYILLLIFMLLLMPNLNILPHIKKGEIVDAIDLGLIGTIIVLMCVSKSLS